jgi:hypothetical protein
MVVYLKKYRNLVWLLFFFCVLFYGSSLETEEAPKEESAAVEPERRMPDAGVVASFREKIFDAGIIPYDLKVVYLTPKEKAAKVYTFLQGPRAYGESLPWSGDWCEKIVSSNSFGGFGCGLCCMANIYSTLSPYECSPWDMYEFATQASLYYPSRESGAIGWDDMKTVLTAAGFTCENYRKPKTYEEFQKQMQQTQSAIVLVSSSNDDAFWADTPGHYVNIWLYQENTDKVFLAEPGDPENNRTWIPLRYVYDALKTVSQYQYLAVTSYSEESNGWKQNGIDDIWNGKYFGIN